jgi:hypothetical protein
VAGFRVSGLRLSQRKKYHPVTLFFEANSAAVRRFHGTMAEYAPTPLVDLDNLAAELGVAKVFVKDESHRFGLNSFKALGGSFGMARLLADKLGQDMEDITDQILTSADVKNKNRSDRFCFRPGRQSWTRRGLVRGPVGM